MYTLAKLAQYKVIVLAIASLVFGVIMAPQVLFAQAFDPDDPFGVDPIQGGDGEEGIILGGEDLRTTAARIINVALSLLGIVAVVIILIGGFKWMTAGGSEDKVGEARKLIFAGIIGMAIILSAWAITKFVLNALGSATNPEGFDEIQ